MQGHTFTVITPHAVLIPNARGYEVDFKCDRLARSFLETVSNGNRTTSPFLDQQCDMR
jgi:hypothetical protein